jgi:hypothetical protein
VVPVSEHEKTVSHSASAQCPVFSLILCIRTSSSRAGMWSVEGRERSRGRWGSSLEKKRTIESSTENMRMGEA